ncbi:hypothetical protein DSUL_20111 [Desulfovibrionales bacterium]
MTDTAGATTLMLKHLQVNTQLILLARR